MVVWIGLVTSVITGASAVLAVIATQAATTKRELVAREQERREAAARARAEIHGRLTEAAAKLRTHLEFIGKKRWADMDARLERLEELATEISVGASSVARLGEEEPARAAREVSRIAVALAAQVAAAVEPAGEFRNPIDFRELDEAFDGFLTLIGRAVAESAVPPLSRRGRRAIR